MVMNVLPQKWLEVETVEKTGFETSPKLSSRFCRKDFGNGMRYINSDLLFPTYLGTVFLFCFAFVFWGFFS